MSGGNVALYIPETTGYPVTSPTNTAQIGGTVLALLTARPWPQPLVLTVLFLLLTAAAALLACGPVAQPAPAEGNALPSAQQVPVDVPTALPSAQQEGEAADPTEPPFPPEGTLTYPKIRNNLQDDVVDFEEAQDAASGPSGQSDSAPEDTAVFVEIFLSGNKAEVAAWLRGKGITPGHADDPDISNLDAYVSLSLLGELSQQDGVIEIEQIAPPFNP